MACCVTLAAVIALLRAGFRGWVGGGPVESAFAPVARRPPPGARDGLPTVSPRPPLVPTRPPLVATAGLFLDAAMVASIAYVAVVALFRALGVDVLRAFGVVSCACCAPGTSLHALGMGVAVCLGAAARIGWQWRQLAPEVTP